MENGSQPSPFSLSASAALRLFFCGVHFSPLFPIKAFLGCFSTYIAPRGG